MMTFRQDACPLQIKMNVTYKNTRAKVKNNSALYTENLLFLCVNINVNIMLHWLRASNVICTTLRM